MTEENPFGTKAVRPPIRKTPVARLRDKTWGDTIDYSPLEIDEEGQDKFRIPRNILDQIKTDDGVVLQWVTESVYGQPMTTHTAKFLKNHWTPIYQSDLGGVLDGRFMPKGKDEVIRVDGMVLMARPAEVDARARRLDKREADEPLNVKRAQIQGGDQSMAGADHPSALATNRLRRTIEPIAIPDES